MFETSSVYLYSAVTATNDGVMILNDFSTGSSLWTALIDCPIASCTRSRSSSHLFENVIYNNVIFDKWIFFTLDKSTGSMLNSIYTSVTAAASTYANTIFENDRKIYLMYTQGSNTELYIYDIDSSSFTEFYLSDTTHRYKSMIAAKNLFHLGGRDGNGAYYCLSNTVYYFDASTGFSSLIGRVEVNTTHVLSTTPSLATVVVGAIGSTPGMNFNLT